MHKIIGALLLLLSALWAAFSLINKEKKRMEQLQRFHELMKYIGRNIESFDLPIGDIVKNADPHLLSDCDLRDDGSIAPKKELLQKGKEGAMIFGFFSELGRGYREDELKRCEHYSRELEAALEVLRAEYPKKRKLALTLCICAALGTIILLL